MGNNLRRNIGIGFLVLALLAIVVTPGDARVFTFLGVVILAFFLLGLEKLVRGILGKRD
jgi:hypothetical protein